MIRFALLSVAVLAMNGCPPSPAPPVPDASDAAPPAPMRDAAPTPSPTAYQRACSNLASLACAEGAAPDCAAVLEHAQAARLTTFDLPCLITATSKSAVRACGLHNVACP